MLYNARNQLVLMQDGKQASAGQWLASQYDDFGRPTATGFATSTALNATTHNPTLSSTLTTTEFSTTAGIALGKPTRTKNYLGTYCSCRVFQKQHAPSFTIWFAVLFCTLRSMFRADVTRF